MRRFVVVQTGNPVNRNVANRLSKFYSKTLLSLWNVCIHRSKLSVRVALENIGPRS